MPREKNPGQSQDPDLNSTAYCLSALGRVTYLRASVSIWKPPFPVFPVKVPLLFFQQLITCPTLPSLTHPRSWMGRLARRETLPLRANPLFSFSQMPRPRNL